MKNGHSIHDLEARANQSQHRWEWWTERVGWIAMGLIVIAAMLGFLGPGPLTWKESVADDGSLAIKYDAVEHYAAPGQLVIRVSPNVARKNLRLVFSRSFCDNVTPESIVPRPAAVEARDDAVIYTFAISSAGETVVTYRYTYEDFAIFDHRIAIDDGAAVQFRQWVLP